MDELEESAFYRDALPPSSQQKLLLAAAEKIELDPAPVKTYNAQDVVPLLAMFVAKTGKSCNLLPADIAQQVSLLKGTYDVDWFDLVERTMRCGGNALTD